MTTLRSAGAPALWQPRRFRSLCLLQVVAVVVVVVAALGARNTGDFSEQTNWTALAVVGLMVGSLASSGWLLVGRREVGRRRARVARSAASLFDRPEIHGESDALRVATTVMTRYHRAECSMVRGKDAVPASIADHHRAERTACAICGA